MTNFRTQRTALKLVTCSTSIGALSGSAIADDDGGGGGVGLVVADAGRCVCFGLWYGLVATTVRGLLLCDMVIYQLLLLLMYSTFYPPLFIDVPTRRECPDVYLIG